MVRFGIDNIDCYKDLLSGKRLGLITSVSGTTNRLRSTIDVLNEKFSLLALFSPEHGVRGNFGAGEEVGSYRDEQSGIMVHSLYSGNGKHLTRELLDGIDTLVYDIQDIGARYYTFISTLRYAIEDCAKFGKELVILDKPNPLGDSVEGNVLKAGFESFVGAYPICMRYGLTAGEFGRMVNDELSLNCRLSIVPVTGWKRAELMNETGNYWMMPSLGVPKFLTALLYPGTCLFEGTNLSEGRGTTCPFEIIGAPFINAARLSEEANRLGLPSVIFTPAYFTPSFSKYLGQQCEGVHLHITSCRDFLPVRTGISLIYLIKKLYENDFSFLPPEKNGSRPFISSLLGSGDFEDDTLPERDMLLRSFEKESGQFKIRKQKYHIYD